MIEDDIYLEFLMLTVKVLMELDQRYHSLNVQLEHRAGVSQVKFDTVCSLAMKLT